MLPLFDTHAHYQDVQYDPDRKELLEEMRKKGVQKIVNIGTSVEDSKASIALVKQYPGFLYATCGIHPEELPETQKEIYQQVQQLEEIAKQKEVLKDKAKELKEAQDYIDYKYDLYKIAIEYDCIDARQLKLSLELIPIT